MDDPLNKSIHNELNKIQGYPRFIYIGSLIGSLFLMVFAIIDLLFLHLYIDGVSEGIASIILFIIHRKEAKNAIHSWMVVIGIITVSIVLMIGVFANHVSYGATIWLAIVPFICFLFLSEKLGFITSILLSIMFISTFSYFCNMHPEKGFNIYGLVTTAGALTCSTTLAWAFANNRTRLITLLSKQARMDTLTPLFNRRGLMSYFNFFINLYNENGQELSVLILDLDNFKRINDNYGHDIGDEFIIACANLIKAELRNNDIAARLGGEEYIVLLPATGLKEAENLAYNINKAIEDLIINANDNSPITVTASIGIACASSENSSFQTLYKAADKALYKAKNSGRNCIVVD